MPNTEIEAQYYSKLLMLTSAALVESGFDPTSTHTSEPDGDRSPNRNAVRALYAEMLRKALDRPETMYGSSPAQIARAKIQTLARRRQLPETS